MKTLKEMLEIGIRTQNYLKGGLNSGGDVLHGEDADPDNDPTQIRLLNLFAEMYQWKENLDRLFPDRCEYFDQQGIALQKHVPIEENENLNLEHMRMLRDSMKELYLRLYSCQTGGFLRKMMFDPQDGIKAYTQYHTAVNLVNDHKEWLAGNVMDRLHETYSQYEKLAENYLITNLSREDIPDAGALNRSGSNVGNFKFYGDFCMDFEWCNDMYNTLNLFRTHYGVSDEFIHDDDVVDLMAISYEGDDESFCIFGRHSDNYPDPSKEETDDVLEGMLCSDLSFYPAGDYHFRVLSFDGRPVTFKKLNHYVYDLPEISGGKIYTDPSEAKKVIHDTVLLMNDLLQYKLKPGETLKEFNSRNPNQKIPYHRLLITGITMNADANTLQELQLLYQNGSRCGISVCMYIDPAYAGQLRPELLSFFENLPCAFGLVGTITNRLFSLRSHAVWIDLWPLMDAVLNTQEQYDQSIEASRNRILSLTDVISDQERFSGSSAKGLVIPIGLDESGKVQNFEAGNFVANGTSHYAIIAGPTGSGKSTFLHTLITSCLLKYGPEEVQLYLMDFKEGTEFKVYEDYPVPQIACVALDASQDFGLSILKRMMDLMTERADLFKQAGSDVTDIEKYRAKGYSLPRIFLIADEFQVLFNRDLNRKAADESAVILGELISKARVYGINIVFATQTLSHIFTDNFSINPSSVQEMHIRIGLQCQEKEEERLFGTANVKKVALKRSTRKGSAIYLENDIVSEPVSMQTAYMDKTQQLSILKEISEYYSAETEESETVYFRGKETPELKLHTILNGESAKQIMFGLPLSMDDAVSLSTVGHRKNNILLIGENAAMMKRMERLMIDQMNRVYLVDGAVIVDESSVQDLMSTEEKSRLKAVNNVFRVISTIRELHEIYQDRKKRMAEGADTREDRQQIWFFVSNYQWVEPVMKMMENANADISEYDLSSNEESAEQTDTNPFAALGLSNSTRKNSVGTMMHTLIESGHLCGIHTVFTCAEPAVLKKMMMSQLAPFNVRILMRSSNTSMQTFVDTTVNLAKIQENTVLYSDGVHEPVLIRPFEVVE